LIEKKDIELICRLNESWTPGTIEVKRIAKLSIMLHIPFFN